jgi:hypothetical protein
LAQATPAQFSNCCPLIIVQLRALVQKPPFAGVPGARGFDKSREIARRLIGIYTDEAQECERARLLAGEILVIEDGLVGAPEIMGTKRSIPSSKGTPLRVYCDMKQSNGLRINNATRS